MVQPYKTTKILTSFLVATALFTNPLERTHDIKSQTTNPAVLTAPYLSTSSTQLYDSTNISAASSSSMARSDEFYLYFHIHFSVLIINANTNHILISPPSSHRHHRQRTSPNNIPVNQPPSLPILSIHYAKKDKVQAIVFGTLW
ncbi:hypothetical protein BD410DRAFT_846858 [Rickenella mellea]|uniref:Uncharacterized protein n=1 Tax=Rickenella mellea TaxID=50990 RepID=A0A4Y7PE22_9AGAM|nr:hypothetical protein BD410DRAFT_846858 [Rickenella mellea]